MAQYCRKGSVKHALLYWRHDAANVALSSALHQCSG